MPIVFYRRGGKDIRPAIVNSGQKRFGGINKGAPRRQNSKGQMVWGEDLTWFRPSWYEHPTFTEQEANEAWEEVFGKQASVLRNVQFLSDNIDMVFKADMIERAESKNGNSMVIRRCDGETMTYERTRDGINRQPRPCAMNCKCAPTGELLVYLPDLCAELRDIGEMVLKTHGITDIDQWRNTLEFVYRTTGRLRGIAFILRRVPVQFTLDTGVIVTKSVVRLELDEMGAQYAARLSAGEVLTLSAGTTASRPALPAPQYADEYNKFDESGDDLPEQDAPDKGTGDVWEDDEHESQAMPDRHVGTGQKIEIRLTGKGRHYVLKLDNGTPLALYGFDGIRAISEWWQACADSWKEMEPGTYPIPPLNVFTGQGGLRFEGDEQPSIARLS